MKIQYVTKNISLAISAAILISAPKAFAGICQTWGPTQQVGAVDPSIIDEASGLAVSKEFSDTLFHINDSGDGPNIYKTNLRGGETSTILISGFEPKDVEDLALGKCQNDKSCIVVGDIGDNREQRDHISLVLINEKSTLNRRLSPLSILDLNYPDRPHNAEGMAIHPNGDLYILTKEFSTGANIALPAQLFRLSKRLLNSPAPGVKMLQKIGQFDLPSILSDNSLRGQIVTGFDISPDGKKLLILTYEVAIEVNMDLSHEFRTTDTWERNQDYTVTATAELPQQEAIAYLPGGNEYIYSTEFHEEFGSAPIYKTACMD